MVVADRPRYGAPALERKPPAAVASVEGGAAAVRSDQLLECGGVADHDRALGEVDKARFLPRLQLLVDALAGAIDDVA